MQPQSDKSLVDRFLEWWRGLWGQSRSETGTASGIDSGPSKTESAVGTAQSSIDTASQSVQERVSGANDQIRESVSGLKRELEDPGKAATAQSGTGEVNTESAPGATGTGTEATGASSDEFAAGGYTAGTTSPAAVDAAADPGAGANATLEDQVSGQAYPPSGNYGRGNLGPGAKGSLGAAGTMPGESEGNEADTAPLDTSAEGVASSGQGIVDTSGPVPETATLTEDSGVPGSTGSVEADLLAMSDPNAEIPDLEDELQAAGAEFTPEGDQIFDANSTALAGEADETLADVGYQTTDYDSAALDDAGMRIVDEADAGLDLTDEGDVFYQGPDVDGDPAGIATVDEAAADTSDARSLSDYTQVESGFASEADTGGSDLDAFEGVATGTDVAIGDEGEDVDATGSQEGADSAQGLYADQTTAGDVLDLDAELSSDRATEDLADAPPQDDATQDAADSGGELGYLGLFGQRDDVEVTDLSYLDSLDNDRFDFTASAAAVEDAAADVEAAPEAVADDIAASPTGVVDETGVVASNVTEIQPGTAALGTNETEDVTAADVEDATSMGDDIGASPTGVADGTGAVASEVEAAEPVAGDAGTAAAATSSTGGRIRGDGSGMCPDDYPIKGNGSSKIYHTPGLPSYRGTKAEWCFATEDDAISAGFRAPGGQRNRAAGGGSAGGAAPTATGTEDAPQAGFAGTAAEDIAHTDASMPPPLSSTTTSGATDEPDSGSLSDLAAGAYAGETVGTDAADAAIVPPVANVPFGTTDSGGAREAFGTVPESSAATQGGGLAGDEAWSPRGDAGDDFGSGRDDIASLESPSPDDVSAVAEADVHATIVEPWSTDEIDTSGTTEATGTAPEVEAFTNADGVPFDHVQSSEEPDASASEQEPGYAGAVHGDGTKVCPADYPVKGNAGSMIYHIPGRASYDATIPEWCFENEDAAAAAGFRAPKR